MRVAVDSGASGALGRVRRALQRTEGRWPAWHSIKEQKAKQVKQSNCCRCRRESKWQSSILLNTQVTDMYRSEWKISVASSEEEHRQPSLDNALTICCFIAKFSIAGV